MTKTGYVLTVAVALLLVAQPTSQAQEPREIVQICKEELREIVHRCVLRNADTTRECRRRINALLEDGKVDEAVAVARRCATKIDDDTDQCVDVVHHLCRRCIHVLLDLDAREAARHMADVCEEAVHFLRHSQRRAHEAIKNALES